MPYLNFIEDKILEEIIRDTLDKGQEAIYKAESKFGRNIIDPFSVILEMASFGIEAQEWINNEKIRQAQKSLSNHIGNFHQRILGSVNEWKSLGSGQIVDIVNNERKIIGEIKNKHNTLKASDRAALYFKLEDLVMRKGHMYKGYTSYYIEIVPKKSQRYDIEFTPSNASTGSKCFPNPLIRQIDGYSFYALVTGVDNALEQLFAAIPTVITKLKPEFKLADQEFIQVFFESAFG